MPCSLPHHPGGTHHGSFIPTCCLKLLPSAWMQTERKIICLSQRSDILINVMVCCCFFSLLVKTKKHPSFSWLILIWIIFNNCSVFNLKSHCIKYVNFWTLHDSWWFNWTGLVCESVRLVVEWMCWTWKKGSVSSCSSLALLRSCGASDRLREGSTHTWMVFPFSVSPLVLTAGEFWQRSCLYLVAHLENGRWPKEGMWIYKVTRVLWPSPWANKTWRQPA